MLILRTSVALNKKLLPENFVVVILGNIPHFDPQSLSFTKDSDLFIEFQRKISCNIVPFRSGEKEVLTMVIKGENTLGIKKVVLN